MGASPAAASVGARPEVARLTTRPKAALLEAESWHACQWVKRLPKEARAAASRRFPQRRGQVPGEHLLVAGVVRG